MLSVLASILVLLVPTANADQTRVEHVRVELMTPGGPLPFVVELRSSIKQNEDGSVDPFHAATVINGDERLRVGSVEVEWETNEHRSTLFTQQSTQQHVTLGFPHFDSTLEWTMYRGPTQDTRGSGFWRKQRTTSVAQLPLFVEIIEGTHGALADLVRAYPTTIFLNADNEIVEIHTGFTGPATGDAYTRQHERYVSIIESLINDD